MVAALLADGLAVVGGWWPAQRQSAALCVTGDACSERV
jgi:hypothetical protein